MPNALFLRLLASEDKGADLAEALAAVRQGQKDPRVFEVDPESLRQIPGAPFAYWVSERVRRLFVELPPFEGEGRTVKQGLATADDFRFVRAWWEVAPERILDAKHGPDWREDLPAFQAWCRSRTYEGKRWVPFAKGGEYSPYYADIHLVVNWEWEGKEIKERINPESGKPYSNVWQLKSTEKEYFFRPGLTWPLRTNGLSFRVLPAGCVFSHKGPAACSPGDDPCDIAYLLSVVNSASYEALVAVQLARTELAQSYEVGLIGQTPVPPAPSCKTGLAAKARLLIALRRLVVSGHEPGRLFATPDPLVLKGVDNLKSGLSACSRRVAEAQTEADRLKLSIDAEVRQLYQMDDADTAPPTVKLDKVSAEPGDEEGDSEQVSLTAQSADPSLLASSLLSYLLGSVFGRWDVRLATGERPLPELPDPFDPLPVCSPGMLQGEDGLPLRLTPAGYPLSVDWDGILVDDPGHPDDLITHLRQVLEVIYPDRASAIETELTQFLEVRDLRDYFRRPGKGGFWQEHISRYSKSRRKAPLYWLLQSKKKNYALWLYYHRLDQDLLYKALVNYVEPKLRLEESRLKQMEEARILAGPTGREAKQLSRQAEQQEELVQELTDFAQALRRSAELHLVPDLDDGVLLNIAPLWELVPWKEAATTWKELLAGKYEWSSIGQQLQERGMVRG